MTTGASVSLLDQDESGMFPWLGNGKDSHEATTRMRRRCLLVQRGGNQRVSYSARACICARLSWRYTVVGARPGDGMVSYVTYGSFQKNGRV